MRLLFDRWASQAGSVGIKIASIAGPSSHKRGKSLRANFIAILENQDLTSTLNGNLLGRWSRRLIHENPCRRKRDAARANQNEGEFAVHAVVDRRKTFKLDERSKIAIDRSGITPVLCSEIKGIRPFMRFGAF